MLLIFTFVPFCGVIFLFGPVFGIIFEVVLSLFGLFSCTLVGLFLPLSFSALLFTYLYPFSISFARLGPFLSLFCVFIFRFCLTLFNVSGSGWALLGLVKIELGGDSEIGVRCTVRCEYCQFV